jgi:hypothetical protein
MASLTVAGILVSKSFFALLNLASSEFIDRDLCVEVCFRTLVAFNLSKCVRSTSAYNSIYIFSADNSEPKQRMSRQRIKMTLEFLDKEQNKLFRFVWQMGVS